MNNLGVAYDGGCGVKEDVKEAVKWYQKAAEMGDAGAQGNLGMFYFGGRGVPLDFVQAYKWFKLSAMQNGKFGVWGLAQYDQHQLLTPDQLAEAEKMVFAFRPTHAPTKETANKEAASKEGPNKETAD
jgi:TPR repeat protein